MGDGLGASLYEELSWAGSHVGDGLGASLCEDLS